MSYLMDQSKMPVKENDTETKPIELKNLEIMTLSDYRVVPDNKFWQNFPHREIPVECNTSVNVSELARIVNSVESSMSRSQKKRASRIIHDLYHGASATQKNEFPPITVANANSAFDNGIYLTDKIASWIKCSFVSGPFEFSPLPGFRSNSLMAIERNGKVRPIINLSSPKGRSYNDNINKIKLEKVNMSSAKAFSYMVKENGKGASIWKFDICDAYKLVPAVIEELRLQGFTWLGRSFVETQKIFGGADSVCGFDRLGDTIEVLAVILSKVKPDSVARALDDFVHICKRDSISHGQFASCFKDLCARLNIKLAENCPNFEKAFENTTRGVVLGVGFDTIKGEWYLTKEKVIRLKNRCLSAATKSHLDLKETEQLMGSINDLCQVCPMGKFYKSEGYRLLRRFDGNENILLMTSSVFKQDMLFFSKLAEMAKYGMPISPRPCLHSLSALHFYSDASGAVIDHVGDIRIHLHKEGTGAACIGGEFADEIWCYMKVHWPESFMKSAKDEKGAN